MNEPEKIEIFECVFPKPEKTKGSPVTELPKDPMSFLSTPTYHKDERTRKENNRTH